MKVRNPIIGLICTKKFQVYSFLYDQSINFDITDVFVDLNCEYTKNIVLNALAMRPWCKIVSKIDLESSSRIIQVSDFENIDWDIVLKGRHGASSYLVRKGLSRKAQMALQIKRYISKHPDSILKTSFPVTIIIETWNAFDEIKVDFGGGTFASFDSSTMLQTPLRKRLEWCLEDVKEIVVNSVNKEKWHWILKPSVTNKGMAISVHQSWESILDSLELDDNIREWVLQKYISNPLLISRHKFHFRVYILCVGSLKVYVCNKILMLLAAHKYKLDDLDDVYRHLTNTARSAEDINFDEKKFVLPFSDLSEILSQQGVNDSENICVGILRQIKDIVRDLFSAFENEYTIFAPMSNCFEVYGLDFISDSDYNIYLLEANPGPDFKQTGDRLREIIVDLWEGICKVVLDPPLDKSVDDNSSFSMVYEKEWSTSNLSGMKLC